MATVNASQAVNSQALTEMATFMVGKVVEAAGIVRQGSARAVAADFSANQLETLAGQELASSQREAQEQRRQGRLRSSRALAVAAASGAGTGGTAEDIISDLDAETAFRAGIALFQGEDKARFLRGQAAVTRFGGQQAKRASKIAAVGTIFSGTGSLLGKYGDVFRSRTQDARFSEINASFNPRITG